MKRFERLRQRGECGLIVGMVGWLDGRMGGWEDGPREVERGRDDGMRARWGHKG